MARSPLRSQKSFLTIRVLARHPCICILDAHFSVGGKLICNNAYCSNNWLLMLVNTYLYISDKALISTWPAHSYNDNKTILQRSNNNLIITITSIWCNNMQEYLSADIICMFREANSFSRGCKVWEKTVSFEKKIMSKDKYLCIFLKPNI